MEILNPSVSLLPQARIFYVPPALLFETSTNPTRKQISQDFDLFPNDLDLDTFDIWAVDDGLFTIDGFEDPPPIE